MLAKVFSAAVQGVDGLGVEIEVNSANGLMAIVIVGLPDTAVRESRDRVTTAVSNSLLHWPKGRTTINLAPADVRKEGPSFDLPIAIGLVGACEDTPLPDLSGARFPSPSPPDASDAGPSCSPRRTPQRPLWLRASRSTECAASAKPSSF
jgi:hypothetical protein